MAVSIYTTVRSAVAAQAARPGLVCRAAAGDRKALAALARNRAAIGALMGAEVVELPAKGTLDEAYRRAGGELINAESPVEYQWVSPTGNYRRLAAGLSSLRDGARWESLRVERLRGRWVRVSAGDWPADLEPVWHRASGFEVEVRLRLDGGLDARQAIVAIRSRGGAEWTWFMAPEGAMNSPLDRQVADLAVRTTLVAKHATRWPDTSDNFLSVELLDGEGYVTYSRDFDSWSMYRPNEKSGRNVLRPDFVRLAFSS